MLDVWESRREENKRRDNDKRTEWERDYARLIHSAAFRRLQSKTQVLGLGESDFYRTRLTHSMEVAQIGTGILRSLKAKYKNQDQEIYDVLPDEALMNAICLAHDIGHPPFGHGGEVALNIRMREHGGFEGNGQTLRIRRKKPIPSAASAVNHITDDMVAFAPMFDSVLQQFLAFIGDDVLAGHNINRFDMKFLYRDCERYFGQTLTNDYIDTLKLARLCLPELSHHRLGDLAQYYGISTAGAHRALNDCRMNQQVFEKLAKELDGTTGRRMEIKNCPVCGQPLKKRNGRFGEFWGCTGFPTCRYTENI